MSACAVSDFAVCFRGLRHINDMVTRSRMCGYCTPAPRATKQCLRAYAPAGTPWQRMHARVNAYSQTYTPLARMRAYCPHTHARMRADPVYACIRARAHARTPSDSNARGRAVQRTTASAMQEHTSGVQGVVNRHHDTSGDIVLLPSD